MITSEDLGQFGASFESASQILSTGVTFNACMNAHGMYETNRFALRLSPMNHQLLEGIGIEPMPKGSHSPETLIAFSTYIHETVHWWQHVGSTSGLLLSLSYLTQTLGSLDELKNSIAAFGPKKPLKKFADDMLREKGHSAQQVLAPVNLAVNNALDIEYYKLFALDPRKFAQKLTEEIHFEGVSYSYTIAYSHLITLIAEVLNEDYSNLPNANSWEAELMELTTQEAHGFHHTSNIYLPATGMQAIYEGQARFIQIQFLDSVRPQPFKTEEWREQGYLSGIYVDAFEAFLKLTESAWPETLADPIVSLFLLVCDLSINPMRGFPLQLQSLDTIYDEVDVGTRFTYFCTAIKEMPDLRSAIKECSREEYFSVAERLTSALDYDNPLEGLRAIRRLMDAPGTQTLMEEHSSFEYDPRNIIARVLFSHFLAFNADKLVSPELFCWPGLYLAGKKHHDLTQEVWLRHLSLFGDKGEGTAVYPRKWPNKNPDAVKAMFEMFYNSIALYDLTRQWILSEGDFVCDYRWLAENYKQSDADEWGDQTFREIFGVKLRDFDII